MCDWIANRIGRENVFLAMPGDATEQELIGYPVVGSDQRRQISHVVFAGGGYFGEPNFGLLKRFRWQRRNRKTHLNWLSDYSLAKKAIFGVGVGPITFPSYRRAARRLFIEADPVYVRDRESLIYAKQYNLNADKVRLGTDLALSIPRAITVPEKSFAIHATGLPPKEIEAIFDALVERGMIDPDRAIDILFDGAAAKKSINRYQETLGKKRGHDKLNFVEYRDVDSLVREIGK